MEAIIVNPMTLEEKKDLETLESFIEPNLRAFYLVGAALMKIKESNLYRDSYDTWPEYCSERWGMGKSHANNLINAAEFVESLCLKEKTATMVAISDEEKNAPIKTFLDLNKIKSSEFPIPLNERQIRPLLKLKPEQRVPAWEKVVNRSTLDGVPITGKLVQEIVIEILTSKAKEKLKKRMEVAKLDKNSEKKDVPEEFVDQFQSLIDLLFTYVNKNWSGLSKKKVREYIEDLWDVVNEGA